VLQALANFRMAPAAFLVHDSSDGRHPAGQVERVGLPVNQAFDGFVRLPMDTRRRVAGQQGAAGVVCGWLTNNSWAARAGLHDFRANLS
jgi:hypothetical protein